jgi:hypothetical protein
MPITLAPSAPYTLMLIVSASDCAGCLAETDAWNRLAQRKDPALRIIGIVINSGPTERDEYARGFAPRFPLYYAVDATDPASVALRGATPLKVLFDSHRRPILAEAGGSLTSTFSDQVVALTHAR